MERPGKELYHVPCHGTGDVASDLGGGVLSLLEEDQYVAGHRPQRGRRRDRDRRDRGCRGESRKRAQREKRKSSPKPPPPFRAFLPRPPGGRYLASAENRVNFRQPLRLRCMSGRL